MPLPTLTRVTDGVDDVLADHQNEKADAIEAQAKGVPLADYANTETLTENKALANTDGPLHYFDPGGSDRTITLPAESSSNHPFDIFNTADAPEALHIEDASAVLVATLAQGQSARFVSNGSLWRVQGAGGGGSSGTADIGITMLLGGL